MFQLPNSQSSLVLYVNVVDRLIRMKPDSVPKILAKAIFKLFEQIDFIDLECRLV
ncbi:hypothetical protein MHBO_001570 [Bonamia ostreae]|uniref:Uncharacterized protein n=1 Tax=Bonamia ostreae TaxID=126728 RepID=A0ABV2AJF9_9EUKA